MSILLVTGTDTGVGKTVVTAALAATAGAAGCTVAVLKPAQTGVGPGEESDMDTVARLAAPVTVKTLADYPDPLAPAAAARAAGRPALALDSVLTTVTELRAAHDVVLIEGAGGLLVPMGVGWTTADLAQQLGGPVIVVAHAGLGTLNHTGLTLEALSRRGIPAFVVIGSWPARPELVHRTNLTDLPGSRVGVVPEGVAGWPLERFTASAPKWFSTEFITEVLTSDED
ncbi:ATP-dependent dethiobiotin synthetase BioD [Virgisporangium aliadipatigenens]|uniref:ATP-dependent dethiobiotin synthetase BioD n=1 Tax=Virgisporangium aliadipatigenens TaxID=741659 RepID=A0A8J3YUA6_9ACTN|nr:dethiobiotin synthase [Virgisporangium aliadipatigenens]GIJ52039.1 ATP-dependent dethiobiotin synthetase BioD [Virgisporangium aliadipatigenens]